MIIVLFPIIILASIFAAGAEISSEQIVEGSSYEYTKHGSAHPSYHCDIIRADTVGDIVYIPATLEGYDVTCITEGAFSGSSISCVIIPPAVSIIHRGAFSSCPNLKDAYFLGDRPSMDGAFEMKVLYHALPNSSGWTAEDRITVVSLDGSDYALMPDCAMVIGGKPSDGILTIGSYVGGLDVKRIGPYAFAGSMMDNGEIKRRSDIKEVRMPEGIEIIGERAFYYSDISSIRLPNSVTVLNDEAFRGCVFLESVNLDSVRSIGFETFRDCASIRNVFVAGSVERCGDGAFYLCTGLETAMISLHNIPNRMLGYCENLESVKLKGVTSIGGSAFFKCSSLISLDLDGVRTVGEEAFRDCTMLENTALGDVETIGHSAFRGCTSIREITIPDSVSYLGSYAFADCTEIHKIVSLGAAPRGDDTVFLNVDSRIYCKPEHSDSWIMSDFGLEVECYVSGDQTLTASVIILATIAVVIAVVFRKRISA